MSNYLLVKNDLMMAHLDGHLEDFNRGRMNRDRGDPLVTRDQRSFQFFGKSHVGRIVSIQILSQLPDPIEEQDGGIPCDPNRGGPKEGPVSRKCGPGLS